MNYLKLFFSLIFFYVSSVSAAIVPTASIDIAYSLCISNVQASGYGETGIGIFSCGLNQDNLVTWIHIESDTFSTNKTKWSFSDCPSDTVLDAASFSCIPSLCEEGLEVPVTYLEHKFGDPNTISICKGGCTKNLEKDGCEVSFKEELSQCYIVANGDTYCNATGVMTGSQSFPGTVPSVFPEPVVEPLEPGCLRGKKDGVSVDICVPLGPGEPSTIEGIEVEIDPQTPNCVSTKLADGSTRSICAGGEKNCGSVSGGKYLCYEERVPTPHEFCIQNPEANGACLTVVGVSGVETTEETEIITNDDGTTTTTTTEGSNIYNQGDVTTTTIKNYNGTSVLTTKKGDKNEDGGIIGAISAGNKELDLIKKGVIDGNDVLNKLLGLPEDYDSTTFGTQLEASTQTNIDALIADFTNFVTNNPYDNFSLTSISDWLPQLPSTSCSGSINTTIFGRSFVMSPCERLRPLRDILAWVFSIYAALSVVRTVFSINATSGG